MTSPTKARALAKKRTQETLSPLAALYNSALNAGGKDIIADFGDRQVNSSIGPQWNEKINGIRTTAERIHQAARKHAFLNVRLIWMRRSTFL
ncbi:polymorphic toxin type 15 domain-containing protein [Pseudomonas alabamensis]|uniref:polymorphic toxin type 15 domain-containing protein n=1 Tax=Pseudomonas alabamensis TaxID=3064349 RepID=UPI003F64DAAE